MLSLIQQAILTRKVLKIRYDGFLRTIEPHTLGCSSHSNLLSAWQVAGGSVSGEQHGWKLFDLTKIAQIEFDGKIFSFNRPGYKKGDSRMKRIIAEV